MVLWSTSDQATFQPSASIRDLASAVYSVSTKRRAIPLACFNVDVTASGVAIFGAASFEIRFGRGNPNIRNPGGTGGRGLTFQCIMRIIPNAPQRHASTTHALRFLRSGEPVWTRNIRRPVLPAAQF